jgi:hypothetical protein
MIDWFASKFSMLLFAAGVLGALMFFATFQMQVMSIDAKVRVTEDIARLIDAAGPGSTMTYQMDIGSYGLIINPATKAVVLDGKIERHFTATAASAVINDKPELKIENRGGIVYVS